MDFATTSAQASALGDSGCLMSYNPSLADGLDPFLDWQYCGLYGVSLCTDNYYGEAYSTCCPILCGTCPEPTPHQPCGCEVQGESFCNFEAGSTGACESCSNFRAPYTCDGSTALGRALPAAGAADCIARCFGDLYLPSYSGWNSCPSGYVAITDGFTCKDAAYVLGLTYAPSYNDRGAPATELALITVKVQAIMHTFNCPVCMGHWRSGFVRKHLAFKIQARNE